VRYQIAVRTRSGSGESDYEWNPRLPSSAQWWLQWAPDILFRNPTLVKEVDQSGATKLYLGGLVGSRVDHVNRLIKYDLAVFPIDESASIDGLATLDGNDVAALVSSWWGGQGSVHGQALGRCFDEALAGNHISDSQIDTLDEAVNRAIVGAIKNLTILDDEVQPIAANHDRPLLVGEGAPGAQASAVIRSNRNVLYSSGLNDRVLEEYEQSSRLHPATSLVVADSPQPLRERWSSPVTTSNSSREQRPSNVIRSADQGKQSPAKVPSSGGGCLVSMVSLGVLASSASMRRHQ